VYFIGCLRSLQYIIISATSSRVIISFVFGHKDTGRRGCRKYIVYQELTILREIRAFYKNLMNKFILK